MCLPKMSPKHLPSRSTFEADDVCRANGLPDRNSRSLRRLFRRFPERNQRQIDGVDHGRNVSKRDLIPPNSLTISATNGGVTCAAGLSLIGMSSHWFFIA